MQIGSDLYLYHEKQDAALCGVHCLNALLQGAYFTEIDLMSIARELDEFEQQAMMASGVDSKDFLKFMAEESGNVDESGNYSIQVLSKALEIWGISVIPLMNPEAVESRKNPLIEKAFICNLQSHWLTIRKIGEDWYNLNSLLEEPQYLSPFYLSAFLDTLIAKGYTIFCVRGDLPRVISDPSALDHSWKKVKRRTSSQSSSNADQDKELQAALEASELEAAISMSLQKDAESQQQQQTESKRKAEEIQPAVDEDDEELMEAIRMSQQLSQDKPVDEAKPIEPEEPEPEKGEGIAELQIRMPDSSTLKRRFHKSKTISDILKFATSNNKNDKFQLMTNFPRKVYDNLDSTIEQEGLYPGATLILQKL